ncbi:unnamed protein product [Boreogadus saida]
MSATGKAPACVIPAPSLTLSTQRGASPSCLGEGRRAAACRACSEPSGGPVLARAAPCFLYEEVDLKEDSARRDPAQASQCFSYSVACDFQGLVRRRNLRR